ncbi:MAG: DUF4838 domain-containing protein [Lentisphaeria bacterium]|nr:DUF4838 domain-containing protein [Lentisphaeria bacterium]
MLKHYAILMLCCLGFFLNAMEITPDYTIVTGETLSVTEKKGSQLLVKYLTEIFGKKSPVVSEKSFGGKTKAIYFGNTAYARNNGIRQETLQDEEWLVKAMPDGNLIITGGKLRGTFYAVYEFLELAGCRYFSVGEKHIPKLKSITINDKLNHRGKPVLESRYTYLGSIGMVPRELFSWNKQNRDAAPDNMNGEFFNTRQWGHCHTFHIIGRGFPAECFSLGSNGKRQIARDGTGPGQFCFTSPLTRKKVKEKLGKMIAEDRKKAQAGGFAPMQLWVVSQNDNTDLCQCKNCLAMAKKYGAYSGVLLDFINDLAAAYPDTNFQMDAYQWGEKAPKGIKARKNVYVQFAFLGYEWSGSNDTMKPLTHPVNKHLLQQINDWKKVADNLAMWDYLVVGKRGEPTLYTSIPAMIANLKIYGQAGIKRYFSELEIASVSKAMFNMSFHDLTLYLNMKLTENPFRDVDALINDYFEKYYGPAAQPMQKLFRLLVKNQTATGQALGRQPPRNWKHITPAFLNEANRLLDEAEAAAKGNETYLRRVGFERLPVDMISLLSRKKGNDPENQRLVNRLKKNFRPAVNRLIAPAYRKQTLEKLEQKLQMILTPPPLPPGFPADRTEQVTLDFAGFSGTIIEDPDGFGGKALKSPRISEESHRIRQPQLGIFDLSTRRDAVKRMINRKEIPSDGKFHIYHLGRLKPGNFMHLTGWAHYSWHMRFPLEMPEAQSEYDVYASLKFIGPAYVKGATGPSDFRLDRVFFVRAESSVPKGLDPEKCSVHLVASNIWFRGARVDDPQADGGKAIRLEGKPERHKQNLSLGIFDMQRKRDLIKYTFKPGMIPQDEKYHLHKIGTLKKGHSGKLAGWIHWTWGMQFPTGKLDKNKQYDVYVSLKITGPAYVRGSSSPSAVMCDKVVFAERD